MMLKKKFLNYKIKLQFESEMILWQCGMLGEVVKDVVMAVYIAIFIKGTSKEMLIRMK